MKGIIFDVAAEVVRGRYGEDAWDHLLDAVGSDGVFTALGSYPDAELVGFELQCDHPDLLVHYTPPSGGCAVWNAGAGPGRGPT